MISSIFTGSITTVSLNTASTSFGDLVKASKFISPFLIDVKYDSVSLISKIFGLKTWRYVYKFNKKGVDR